MIAPEVYGDPEAMRALATEIAARANELVALPAGFNAVLDAATFEGPASEALRSAAATTHQRLMRVAAELRDVATALFADASTVENMNADAKADAVRRERERAAAAGSGMPA